MGYVTHHPHLQKLSDDHIFTIHDDLCATHYGMQADWVRDGDVLFCSVFLAVVHIGKGSLVP